MLDVRHKHFLKLHVHIERFINIVDVQKIMAYTEIKERNGRKYYYRVMSIRNDNRVFKKRLYLGTSLIKRDLQLREKKADEKFNLTIKNRKKEVINALKSGIIKILKRYKVKRAGLFGSYAKG